MLNFKDDEREIIYRLFYNKMNRILEIGKKITSTLESEKIVKVFVDEISKLNNSKIIRIGLINKDKNNMNYKVFLRGKLKEESVVSLDDSSIFLSYCLNLKKEVIINDTEYSIYNKSELLNYGIYKISSFISIPLIINDKEIGIVSLESLEKNSYTIEDFKELKIIAGYMAIALKNSYLFSKVQYSAEHDDLTGLIKRNKIFEQGERLSRFIIDENNKLSIIMMDIDYFKNINDRYGHQTGDYVLKEIAKIIKNNTRKDDWAGRYGGEEFLILLQNVSLENAMNISDRIRRCIENYEFRMEQGEKFNVTISCGVYEMNYKNNNFTDGVKRADEALYKAKRSGRNKCIS